MGVGGSGKGAAGILIVHSKGTSVGRTSYPSGLYIRRGTVSTRGRDVIYLPGHIMIAMAGSGGRKVSKFTRWATLRGGNICKDISHAYRSLRLCESTSSL